MILSTRAWGLEAGVAALAVLACVPGAPIAAAAVTVTLQPSVADARIDQASPTTSYGSDTTMQVRSQNGGSGRNARALVQFDLSSIPANAVINSATLKLYMITAPAQSRTYEVRRITGTWNEAAVSWQGAPAFSNNTTATAATGTAGGVWLSWTITTDVQLWVNGTANYGTLIKDGSESSNQSNIRADFAAREYTADTTKQPILVVDYQPAYSITLPAGSAVVMGEPALLNFTITNVDDASATETISKVLLTFSYAVASAVPPPGWKVTGITGNQVLFDTELASDPGCSACALTGGQSAVFGVYLTATAAAAEVTNDTVSSATVGNDCTVPGFWSYTFDRSGNFPAWARRGLGAALVATPSSTGVNGTITLTMSVTNRTTGAQNAIAPAVPTVSGGTATLLTGPTPASANLAAGASQNFVWTYRPTTTGTFSFSSSATNGTVRTLNPIVSNDVLVGPLTASLSVSPIQPTNGSQVTVTMTVTNNGASDLTSVTPSALTTSGTATATLVSGPTPGSLASLAAGASTSFMWTYTVSGAVGATFAFTGGATASGGVTSNTAISPSTLTSIASAADVTATVTATYKGVTGTVDVTFTAVGLSLAVSPGSIAADGATTATLTATMTSGGGPLSGRTVTFSATGGTLSGGSAVTNASGQATVTLGSTVASKTTSTANVTAAIGGVTASGSVTLTGITLAEPDELTVLSGGGTNTLYWTFPGSGYINGVLVLRRAAGVPQVPADGAALNVNDALADGSVVVAKVGTGGATSGTDNGLTPGATYYYRAFGYFTSGNLYSTAGQSTDAPGTGGMAGPEWVVSSSAAGIPLPATDGEGGIYWNAPGGGVVGAARADGSRLWTPALTGSTVNTLPLVTTFEGQAGTYAVVGTASGTVAAVNVADGTLL